MKKSLLRRLWILLFLFGCQKEATITPHNPAVVSTHLLLGNPSDATSDTASYLNYLLVNKQFCSSYNRDKGTPNWVSWHLDQGWIGTTDRQDDFRPDGRLPLSWYRVKPNDYENSGFDRGHVCPSADRTRSVEDNSATFLMSNMMPQAANNNRITWENLESYARKLVEEGDELYILAGPLGSGGSGSRGGVTYSILNGKITVPAFSWKVILVLPKGENDLARINASTRVIAVNMPNSQPVNDYDWGHYRLTVDELETLTGLDFFSSLPEALQSVLESKVDNQPI